MTVNPLVFSNHPRYRIARHSLFWICWVLYDGIFTALSYGRMVSFWHGLPGALLEEVGSIPLDMAFCYSIIYLLIPRYLRKGKLIQMGVLWLLFSVLFVASFRYYSMHIMPLLRSFDGLPKMGKDPGFIWDFFSLFSQVNMEGCIAASIKLGKMWSVKEQELILIKKEKQKLEPHMQEGRMQPVFLINALERVGQLSLKLPALVPGMVGRIKQLLLYVIYENNQPSVELGRELKLVEEYVELEKTGMENLTVGVRIRGNVEHERIAPFIILPLVENGFRQLSHLDLPSKSIDLDLQTSEGSLFFKLAWSKPIDSSTLANGNNVALQNIGRRLDLLYPQSHELKVVITTDHFIVDLRIELHRAIN
jgi:hypothetical protein